MEVHKLAETWEEKGTNKIFSRKMPKKLFKKMKSRVGIFDEIVINRLLCFVFSVDGDLFMNMKRKKACLNFFLPFNGFVGFITCPCSAFACPCLCPCPCQFPCPFPHQIPDINRLTRSCCSFLISLRLSSSSSNVFLVSWLNQMCCMESLMSNKNGNENLSLASFLFNALF